MYVKGLFEVWKILGRLGIKNKDIIGIGGDIVKMGKSLFNTRVNPKLLSFIKKNQKIPTKILENIKIHARTLKNASESQKNLFLENIKSIQNAKVPKPPVSSVKQPVTSVKDAAEAFKGWTPKVIKGGKDGLATGGIANHFRKKFGDGTTGFSGTVDEWRAANPSREEILAGVEPDESLLDYVKPRASIIRSSETPVEGVDVDVDDRSYGIAGEFSGDDFYFGGDIEKGNVKVNVQKDGETIYLDTMPKEELKKLYVGLGQKEGNHVEVGTDGEGNYTLNIFTTFAKGGIANHFRERVGLRSGTALASYPPFRGTSGSSGALKAWRGAEMKETLPKSWLPEAGALTSSAILALRDRKPKDESKEDIVESIETIKKEPDQEPPEDPWDPNKLLEVLESTTYNIAENRVKKKAWNYVEKKINERAIELAKKYPNDQNKRRGILGKEFNEFLGKGVDVAGVTKDGTVSYRKGWEKELGYPRSTDLIGTVNERNDKRIKAEAPFRNKGYVTTREFVKILGDKGMEITLGTGTDNRPTIEKQIGQFAKTYGVEILSRGDAQNLGYWIKLPSDKKIEKIVKQNLSEDSKVEIIKNLLEEYDLKSWGQINKALLHEGYVGERGEFFEKHFPQLKGTHFSDKDFVYSKKVPAVIQRIRKQMIENWGSPSLEKFLTSAKHAEGFGEVVHLMHTEQKKKRSETPYNFADLAFGSEAENFEYNKGLDNMRNSFTLALKTIKHDYEGKDLNQKINVPFHLQEKFDFPKTMTVKKYVDRLNYMLTDLAYLTGGKVRGELLDVWGKKMNFIENPAIDYSIVPGKGFLEGKLKKYEGLFKKFKNEVIDGKATGRLVIGEDGYPVLKKGQKLTQNQAEILMTIVEGLATQLTSASESKPVSLETFKEIIQPLSKKAEGGPVLSGVDQYIINRGL